jgi:nucleoside-diphosphate-sugar epimerase
MSVSSFEPHIRGVRNLADFSNAAAKNVPFVFVSSIGTADGWSSSEPVPERCLDDLYMPQGSYGRSKLVRSLILDASAAHAGIPAASVRVGQIAGPRAEKSIWNPQEFNPSLIASSVYPGVLPKSLGPQQEVAWTPVEDIAGLLLDVVGITTRKPVSEISGYFHGMNPAIADWSELAFAVMKFYGYRIKNIVSLKEWAAALEASAGGTVDFEKNLGLKLLNTYRGMLASEEQGQTHMRFAMERTKGHSATIRDIGPITPALMENWCR